MIEVSEITGLILAGGRASRMGGVDKGLQAFHGLPLAQHAMHRLAPQVGSVIVNANRNLGIYRALGMPVFADANEQFSGPLAGMSTGLEHCDTDYLAVVPCDAPFFPLELVHCLATALIAAEADIAVAATVAEGISARQPVFCLMKTTLRANLRQSLDLGQRKVDTWVARQHRVDVVFENRAAFVNVNTLADLERVQAPC